MSNVPEGLKYTKEHEWAKIDGDIAIMGITDFAQHLLTDVVFVELPKVGDQVVQGKRLATVESVKSVSDVFCPISGEVTQINENLTNAPEKINGDCYGDGWIAKIAIKDKAEEGNLMQAAEYTDFISKPSH